MGLKCAPISRIFLIRFTVASVAQQHNYTHCAIIDKKAENEKYFDCKRRKGVSCAAVAVEDNVSRWVTAWQMWIEWRTRRERFSRKKERQTHIERKRKGKST